MDDITQRLIAEAIVADDFKKLLKLGKPLRLKLGVDPSSADLHLGHSVVLRLLAGLQRDGHKVIFLIGDATARIGDPSGRDKTRPVLSKAQVDANAQTYLDQAGKIIDLKQAEVRRNSQWFEKMTLAELLGLAGQFTVAQLIERDDFNERLKGGHNLGLHELLYPVMQAYDSVMLEADVELGGSDQRFNMLAGRALQKKLDQTPQQVVMTKLLVGTDGKQKMSKSLGNYIGLTDSPDEMYGKVMSLPDELIGPYYELCTDIESGAIDELIATIAAGANPRDAKASLAREIVGIYHGAAASLAAEEGFDRRFKDKTVAPDDIVEQLGKYGSLVDFLVGAGILASRSEVRRKVEEGGVKVNGQKAEDMDTTIKTGDVVSVGKRRLFRYIKQ